MTCELEDDVSIINFIRSGILIWFFSFTYTAIYILTKDFSLVSSVFFLFGLSLLFLTSLIFNYFSMLESYLGVGKNIITWFTIPLIFDFILAMSFVSFFQNNNILYYIVFTLSILGRFIHFIVWHQPFKHYFIKKFK